MKDLFFRAESYRIVGGGFAVYNQKGHGFTEPIYHECLEIEFDHPGIPFRSKPHLTLTHRDRTLTHTFQPGFVCFDKIVPEKKVIKALLDDHRSQVVNYLHAAGYDPGLLINFGSCPNLQYERLLHSRNIRKDPSEADFRA